MSHVTAFTAVNHWDNRLSKYLAFCMWRLALSRLSQLRNLVSLFSVHEAALGP